MHSLDRSLIVSFSLVDRSYDAITIGSLKRNVGEVSIEAEMNVSILEVVIVNLDRSRECTVLGVN